jgi:molybdopterin-containing oxidoreductase family iron-sulfur binding subunit
MPPVDPDNPAPTYWRSLEQLADTPAFRRLVEEEFPGHADALLHSPSRRGFLKLMGASLAMAGLTGCRWPREEIRPFAYRPPETVPGEPEHFATAMDLAGVGTGLLVASYDGRPIKVDGNPLHPGSLGGSNALQQASVLELYDPDRSRFVMHQGTARTWNEFRTFVGSEFGRLRQAGGRGLRILAEASSSPSVADMRARLLKAFPEARWHEYEPISRDNERLGSALAFGRPMRSHLALDAADVIVCFDADPLMSHPNAVRYARDFASRRRPRAATA